MSIQVAVAQATIQSMPHQGVEGSKKGGTMGEYLHAWSEFPAPNLAYALENVKCKMQNVKR